MLLGTPSACPHLRFYDSSPVEADDYSFFPSLVAPPSKAPVIGVLDAADNDIPMDPFLDLMTSSGSNNDQWLVQHAQGPLVQTERPGTPLNEDLMETYKSMAGFCVSVFRPMSVSDWRLS